MNKMDKMNVMKVQFQFIHVDRLKSMEGVGIDHDFMVDNIANDIDEANKILSPLTVVGPYNDGKYIVVDGGRRLNALRKMGIETAPCYLVGDASVSVRNAAALALNANRSQRGSNSRQIASFAKFLTEEARQGNINPKAREAILCNNYCVSPRMARKYILLADRAPAKLLNAVMNDGFKVNWAEAIIRGYEHRIRKPNDSTLDMLMDLFYQPAFKHRNKTNIIHLIESGKVRFENGQAVIDETKIRSYSNVNRARSCVKSVTTSDQLKKSDLKPLMQDFRALLNAYGISVAEFEKETN